jgi:hypothetical protein
LEDQFPEDVIHRIAKRVHASRLRNVHNEMPSFCSRFERIIEQSSVPLSDLRRHFPDLQILVDVNWVDWDLVVMHLTSDRFVLYFKYQDGSDENSLLMEASVSTDAIVVQRLYFETQDEGPFFDMESFASSNRDGFPNDVFVDVYNSIFRAHLPDQIDVSPSAGTNKRWRDHRAAWEWFEHMDWRGVGADISVE